jgi:hypothetical protein
MKLKYTAILLVALLVLASCHKACDDPASYSFSASVPGFSSISPPIDNSLCKYSQVIWYLPASDSVYANHGNTLFPLSIFVDGYMVGTIYGAASVPGSVVCGNNSLSDTLHYVKYTLPDGNSHTWYTTSPGAPTVILTDSIKAIAYDTCMAVKL